MSYSDKLDSSYYNFHYGWVPAKLENDSIIQDLQNQVENLTTKVENYESTIEVSPQTINIGYNIENTNITLGNGEPGTNTTVRTEFFNVGRYIYMHHNNDYSGPTDSGLVMNIQEDGTPMNVEAPGFTTNTVRVNEENGLLPTQIIAVTSALNTGLYQVKTHEDNVITIEDEPDEPFLKSSFNPEEANGIVHPVFVQVIRANSDGESEVAHGTFAPLEYNKYLYDTKKESELGSLEITDTLTLSSGENQVVFDFPSNSTTLTVEESIEDRTLTIPPTEEDDTFAFLAEPQEFTNKTITDKSNDVTARALFVNNGDGTVSTYTAAAPTTNQFLKATSTNAAEFVTVQLHAGNSIQLNNGKSSRDLGAGDITISVKLDEEQDPEDIEETLENPTTPTEPEFPGFDFDIPDIPSIPSIGGAVGAAAAVVGVAAGIFVTVGVAGALGAFGAVKTGEIRDLDDNKVVTFTNGDAEFENNVIVKKNFEVQGNAEFNNVIINGSLSTDGRYIYLNTKDSVNSAKSTGLIATRYPDATIYSLTDWVEGDGSVDPSCSCSTDTGLSEGDIIQVYSTDPSYTGSNTGYYEVQSLTSGPPHILRFKGTLNPKSEDYTKSNVETDNTNTLYGVRVQISGLEFGDDGVPRYISGNNTGTFIKEAVAYDTASPSFNETISNTMKVDSITSKSSGGTDPVMFPKGIAVGDIYEANEFSGIRLKADTFIEGNAQVVGDLAVSTIINTNNDDIFVTPGTGKSLIVSPGRELHVNTIATATGSNINVSHDMTLASTRILTADHVDVDTIGGRSGSSVAVHGDVVISGSAKASVLDTPAIFNTDGDHIILVPDMGKSVVVAAGRELNVNTIATATGGTINVSNNMTLASTQTLTTDRVDTNTIGVRSGSDLTLEDGVILGTCTQEESASKVLVIDDDNKIRYRDAAGFEGPKREFMEDFTGCFGMPGPTANVLYLSADKPWVMTLNNGTFAPEIKANIDFTSYSVSNEGMNGVVNLEWHPLGGTSIRSYCLSNAFTFGTYYYTTWVWEACVRPMYINNLWLDEQYFFAGLGHSLYSGSTNFFGANFYRACGFEYNKAVGSTWRCVVQDDENSITLYNSGITVSDTSAVKFRIVGTRSGSDCTLQFYINDTLVQTATATGIAVQHQLWGPRLVHGYKPNNPIYGAAIVYDYVKVSLY